MPDLKFETVIKDEQLQDLLNSLNGYYVDDFDYGPDVDAAKPITIEELKSNPNMLDIFIAAIQDFGTKEWDDEKFQCEWLSEIYEARVG